MNSAAHGAGRRMSRAAAKKQFRWKDVQPLLSEQGVELISAGLDEVPMAYKDIHEVMAQQADLKVGDFSPKKLKKQSHQNCPYFFIIKKKEMGICSSINSKKEKYTEKPEV